jgi:hypothetical protein
MRSGSQNHLSCASSLMSAVVPPAAPNGGSRAVAAASGFDAVLQPIQSVNDLIAESVLVAHGSQGRQSGAHIDHFCALAGITRRRPDQFGGGEL